MCVQLPVVGGGGGGDGDGNADFQSSIRLLDAYDCGSCPCSCPDTSDSVESDQESVSDKEVAFPQLE